MTNTDQYLGLAQYEDGTTPFTGPELAAVREYHQTVHHSALHDCFDAFTHDHLTWHVGNLGKNLTTMMLREHAGMLTTWYEALDALLARILTCTTEKTSYSTAAKRFIQTAADDYHHTRTAFEHAVTVFTLDLTVDTTTDASNRYPHPTRAINFPMQSLTND